MARMSVDDRFLRDPRVVRMATSLGWSKYEARGRLLDVFAIVYDRVNASRKPVLSVEDIDTAAEFPGLAARMLEFDLAVATPEGLHVRGSNEHTGYLKTRKSSGRTGGIKSGESRRNKAKQQSKVTFDENEGRSNPLPLVLPLPSDLPLPSSGAKAKRSKAKGEETPIPPEWQPTLEHAGLARERNVDLTLEARRFRAHADANDRRTVRWNGAFTQWLLKATPDRASNGNAAPGIRTTLVPM